MDMQEVKSGNIAAIGYDADTKVLAVQFKGSGTYTYADVPADMHADLMAAESKGTFFSHNIRGQFSVSKPEKKA